MAAYETADVSPRFVLTVAAGPFAGMGLSLLIIFGILHFLAPATTPAAPSLESFVVPEVEGLRKDL
jgi:hypothetical protein